MELSAQREIARKSLRFLDEGTTEMAPALYEEPVTIYTSEQVYKQEMEHVFLRVPVFVGMSRDLPEPGSFFTRELAGKPLLFTRDETGCVHAFLNSCQHRGVKLVDGCGKSRRLTCPFHGWVYNPGGELVGMPFAEGFEGLDRTGRGLIEYPAGEAYGLLFASLRPGPEIDLESWLAGLGPDLAAFGFGTWEPIAQPHVHQVRANWKVVYDGFCETYHFLQLHRDTAPHVYANVSAFDPFGRHGRMTTTNKQIDELRSRPEEEWHPLRDGSFNVNYRIFPSLSFSTIGDRRTEIFQVWPGRGPDETVAIHFSYLADPPETDAQREKALADLRFACQTIVDDQDFRVNESTLPGIRSESSARSFVFGRNEPCAQYWHRQLRLALEDQ